MCTAVECPIESQCIAMLRIAIFCALAHLKGLFPKLGAAINNLELGIRSVTNQTLLDSVANKAINLDFGFTAKFREGGK